MSAGASRWIGLVIGVSACGAACGSSSTHDAAPVDARAVDAHSADAATDGDVPAAPVLLVDDLPRPAALALDGEYLYVAARGDSATPTGIVARVPRQGGPLETLYSDQSDPVDVAVNGANVYWANVSFLGPGGHAVNQAPKQGVGTVVTLTSTNPGPDAIAIDGADLFYSVSSALDDRVTAVPIGGGAERDLLTGSAGILYLALDATHAYWSAGSTIVRAVKDGSAAPEIVHDSGATFPDAIALDANTIYWGDSDTIFAMAKSATEPRVVATGAGTVVAIAVDATHVYWADHDPTDGAVRRAPVAGGPVETLASSIESPRDLVIDAASVYWIEDRTDAGAIWKLAK